MKKIRQYVYGLVIAFFFTGSVWANNFSKMPIPEITRYAEQGNLEAQLYLASAYYEGYRVPQSFEQAAMWNHKAAEQNSMDAQFLLGVMYSEGLGVKKDEKQSVEWFRKAALQGDVSAQESLANAYYWGRGVTKDLTQTVKWYKTAARNGSKQAQFEMGRLYLLGEGVSKIIGRLGHIGIMLQSKTTLKPNMAWVCSIYQVKWEQIQKKPNTTSG